MDLSGKKIVVTGGAGFIGSHIADKLVELGAEVVIVDNFSTGRRENISHLADKIKLVEGSIVNTDLMKEVFHGAYAVLHQAALGSVPRSIEFPMDSTMANAVGTLSVFLAARDAGVEKVVYASSSSVYGDTPILPKVETMVPNPLSPYAATKLTGEIFGRLFTSIYNLKTIGLRYFNVFGPRQNPDSPYAAVIPKFIRMVRRGDRPIIFGDGEHTRDFTYVENVVHANILALSARQGFGEVFNISAGNRISLKKLVETIGEILNVKIEPEYLPTRQGDIKDSLADIDKARETLGYEPYKSFEDGLAVTVDSIK